MKRKIICQANQAYTLTLPIKWIRDNGLNKNSEVEVEEKEKDLIIRSNERVLGESVKLDISELDEKSIHRHLTSLYARGVDEIKLISNENISQKIIPILNQMIGYALIKEDRPNYTLKDLNFGGYSNLDEIFKRVFQIVLSFFRSAIDDIFGKEEETPESLLNRDREVNKFCLYLQRSINKMSYPNSIDGRIIFTYSYALEQIGDEIQRLWKTNIKHKPKKTKEIKNLMELSLEGLSRSFDLYYAFSSKKSKDVHKIRDTVRKNSMKINSKNPELIHIIRHIIKIVEEAADLNHLTLMKRL